METIDQIIQSQNKEQLQPAQGKLKITETASCDFPKDIFWKFANKRAQKELKQEFVVDEENVAPVAAFVAYFTNNLDVMQQYGIDPRKGILLIGNPGSGKSILFRTMKDILNSEKTTFIGEREIPIKYLFRRFNYYTCEHMAKLYMKEGEAALDRYTTKAVIDVNREKQCVHACFDDLGAEEIRNNFGNKKEVMVDIILQRYDLFLDYGLLTHFTTNQKPEEIETRYSYRVRSRLKQMCNVISLGATEKYIDRR